MKKIVILDGSVHGKKGNTFGVTEELIKLLPRDFEYDYIELKNIADIIALEPVLRDADGYILATGTYWQSWGSPMQYFLEQATDWEATDLWIGKPICTVVTMHSTGGMEVLGRLQSNFSMFGVFIPPMCSIVHSHVNQLAGHKSHDIWDLRYLPTIAHNFKEALFGTHEYAAWDVDRGDSVTGVWLKKKKSSKIKKFFKSFWSNR